MKKEKPDYSVDLDEANEIYEESILESRANLKRQGFLPCNRPKSDDGSFFSGHMPEGISKASLSEINQVLVKMTAFADYAQELAQRAKEEKEKAEEVLKFAKANIRKSKIGNKSEQDDATITDIRYVTANAEYLTKKHSYEAISVREEAARRDIKTLSRLITTEQISNETGKRSAAAMKPSGRKRWR